MKGILALIAVLAAAPAGAVVAPDMIKLQPGVFVAGSVPAETEAAHYPAENAAREQPSRTVTISHPFAIGRSEVTRGEFARFARATGWRPDGPCSFLADGPSNRWVADASHDWRRPGFAQTDRHPVVCVNLADAQAYAHWLSAQTGRRFRLPSNVEWEYAARAGTATPHWWDGTKSVDPCAYANLSDRRRADAHNGGTIDPSRFFDCADGFVFTAPVGRYRPNPWGLYDMLGNVWEWTEDCLNADQRGAGSGAEPRTSGDCRSHIDRGASWTNSPKYVRAAAQHPDLIEARTTVLGFRLVEELPSANRGSTRRAR